MAHRRATSSDVARLAGVSRTTVSFVLNDRRDVVISEATREKVLAAARALGYAAHGPARQLAGGASHTLGLVLCQSPEQVAVDALLPETLRGLSTAARGAGFRVLVESLPHARDGYADLLHSRQVDGLVVSGPRADDLTLMDRHAAELPIILQGTLPGSPLPSVDIDNAGEAQAAVAHLVGLGHERIACITNAPLAYTAAADRVAGYHAALVAAHLEAPAELLAEGEFDAASGHRAMAELLRRDAGFTAVFVASDVVAMGAIAALREAGLEVPRDVSVVGFDDIPLAGFFDPPLTTVALPAYDLGFSAGQILIERVRGRAVASRTVLKAELAVRGSTAPPRRAQHGTAAAAPAPEGTQQEGTGGDPIAADPALPTSGISAGAH
jgi:LacI family transcriptional regulator